MKDSMKQRLEDSEGYYSLPRITEPFEGQVIKLDAKALNMLYQTYSMNGDQYQFIEKIEKMDIWMADKPHKVYADMKWLTLIVSWLQRDKDRYG